MITVLSKHKTYILYTIYTTSAFDVGTTLYTCYTFTGKDV